MIVLRRAARPMLASIFITGGIDTLRDVSGKAPVAEDVAPPIAARLPGLPADDTEALVRINALVQVGAGGLLAIGKLPRLAALALAATLVPTTAAAHPFWEADGDQRAQQQVHFFKNVSILGGLIIAALDTEGRPGLAWRGRHAAERAGAAGRRGRRKAKREVAHARREGRLAAKAAAAKVPSR